MPNVYKFPPVGVTAYESSIDDPMYTSTGISGAPRYSQTRANRAVYFARVSGLGDGTGYVESLKQLLKGKPPLVQVDTLPSVWWNKKRTQFVGGQQVVWTSGGGTMEWTEGGGEMVWYDNEPYLATAGAGDFPYIDIVGLPSGFEISPGEAVQLNGAVAYVLRPVVTNKAGTRVYLTEALTDGSVSIGQAVTRNFQLIERPRAVQVPGAFSYDFDMREVFASDFSDGLTALNPWG